MEPFLINAALGGAGVALVGGPLGCFIVWLRMSYFGDAIAHAALLGVVAGLALRVDTALGILVTSSIVAGLLVALSRNRALGSDSVLGVLAHGALALGLVLLSLTGIPVDIQGYLFGDILAVSREDIALIYAVALAVILVLTLQWRGLMMMVVSPDMAQVEGVRVQRLRALLMVTVALTVAVSIKVVGILMITSMLIIPAAAARFIANTPHGMVFAATATGLLAVAGGLYASWRFDTPSGPSIILAGLALFAASKLCALRR